MSFWERISAPEDISTYGHHVDSLFAYTTVMNVFYFALVCIGLFGFAYKYSAKRHRKPYYTYGNKKKHLIVTTLIGAAVFFTIDLNITRLANDSMMSDFWNYPEGDNVVRVEVLAQQWMWNFRYAGPDNKFNTDDDYLSNHELVVPEGKKIEFRITSKDVIHSFFLPNARNKVDAIPGRITRLWFEATRSGEFDIACAEMCGTNHYLMKAKLIVLPKDKFNTWQTQAFELARAGNDLDNPDNYWGWKWETN